MVPFYLFKNNADRFLKLIKQQLATALACVLYICYREN